ncbi:MAG: hypothetical protein HY711_04645 [Candidatus Melainabacteria bacterium]|nr:hypothetical protein [Candidatus Melainabacteria bacterium]
MIIFFGLQKIVLGRWLVLLILAWITLAGLGIKEALCREQYQINHPAAAPPQSPFVPDSKVLGYASQFTPDFWATRLGNRVPVGAVLTGILETELSSDKSNAGDTVEITLKDDFAVNEQVIVPAKSRIIGSVVSATPAARLKNGQPGTLQVSLASLVFPDGRNVPFYGFVDHNTNHDPKKESKKRYSGPALADYGQSVRSFFGSFTSGVGVLLAKSNRGLDFHMDKGEILPIRINRSIVLPSPVATTMPSPMMASQKSVQTKPQQMPLKPLTPAIPGIVGADPDEPLVSPKQSEPNSKHDPNAIFSHPIAPTLPGQGDPF